MFEITGGFYKETFKECSRDQIKQFELIKVRVNRCSSYRDLTVIIRLNYLIVDAIDKNIV